MFLDKTSIPIYLYDKGQIFVFVQVSHVDSFVKLYAIYFHVTMIFIGNLEIFAVKSTSCVFPTLSTRGSIKVLFAPFDSESYSAIFPNCSKIYLDAPETEICAQILKIWYKIKCNETIFAFSDCCLALGNVIFMTKFHGPTKYV